MTDLFVLKLGETPDTPVLWGAFAGGRFVEAGRTSDVAGLRSLATRMPDDVRIVAVVPGSQVALRELKAPPKQASKLRAAAAYLLEDELADAIEDVHVVASANADGARAYAISKRLISEWLTALAEAGITPTSIAPDFACIGGTPEIVIFALDCDRIIASRGVEGFAAELDLAEKVGPAFIAAAGNAELVAYGAHEFVSRWVDRPVERRSLAPDAGLLLLFGAHLSERSDIVSLMTGEFRRRPARRSNLGQWRRPAALAASLVAAFSLLGVAAGFRDSHIAHNFEASAATLHKAAFPTFSGGDIRSHARQIMSSGATAASFLEMNRRLTASIDKNSIVRIDRIRYDATRSQFIFSITSKTDAGIEAFRTALNQNGLIASDNGGYRRNGDIWVGEMQARTK